MKKEDNWFTIGKDNCFINDIEVLYDSEECRHITVKTKYGYHRITKVSLNRMVELPKSGSSLDKNLYWKNRILEKNPDIEIITDNLERDDQEVLFNTKYGKCVSTVLKLRSYSNTILNAVDKTEYFINECKEVHGDKYDYSKIVYTGCYEKIKVTCKKHGDYETTAYNFKQGRGCPKCAHEHSVTNVKAVEKYTEEVQSMPYFVYLLELFNENEKFYKIGITNNINNRTSQISSAYFVKVLDYIECSLIDAVKHEEYLGILNNPNSYIPLIKFAGHTECFSSVNFDKNINTERDAIDLFYINSKDIKNKIIKGIPGIFCILNTTTNYRYIGKGKNLRNCINEFYKKISNTNVRNWKGIAEDFEKGHEFIIEFILYTNKLDENQLHYIQFYDNIYNTGSKIITTNLVKKSPTKYLKMTNLLTGEQTIGLKTEIVNKFPNYGSGVRRVLNGDCKQTQGYTFEYCDEYGN